MYIATNQRRVAVTGYGAVCSLGESVPQIWDSIRQYKVGYRRHECPDPSVAAKFFGFIEPDRKRCARFSKTLTKFLPEFAKYALVAAAEALDTAFAGGRSIDDHFSPFERAVIIGTGWGGLDTANINNNNYRSTGFSSSFATLMAMNNAATAAVSMNWNMRGYQNTPVAACATGTMAIGDACELIKSGRAGIVLAGGSESLREQFNVWSIDVLEALSKEQQDVRLACCPFSVPRSGFVLSEGAAILCLEELDAATKRGARILGVVTGYGNYTDACDLTAPAPDMQSRIRAIHDALRYSGKDPSDLDYVNTHGTSTPLGDVNENDAIKAALGPVAYDIPMSSTKSYSGHLVGAAGALEAIFCLKAMETSVVPATIHLDEPDPTCDLNYVPNQHLVGRSVNTALNLSFGFGGSNAAVVLEKAA